MIGTHFQSASNVLDLLIESGDWKKDGKLRQATMRLQRALESADQSPELLAAYRVAVESYADYTAHMPEVSR